ncbi:tetratricopeptide repeat protein [Wenzhouxiangella sp. AB-CW3]|uniref:tetratricopeptide repeat protein n=1 Tax=Wenzhouxiangella sp. AB-CW3 TaxID=2771012 RepID=UPI00168ACA08|nr:tetratricopeptide repeat protein [Wenzhouxiangella sp. AB-CW3]QOC22175.1 tetratricopeptide repeat protein [Wenzhouxiangella sp. AB-CW3]
MSLIHQALQRVEADAATERQVYAAARSRTGQVTRRTLTLGGLAATGLALPILVSTVFSINADGGTDGQETAITEIAAVSPERQVSAMVEEPAAEPTERSRPASGQRRSDDALAAPIEEVEPIQVARAVDLRPLEVASVASAGDRGGERNGQQARSATDAEASTGTADSEPEPSPDSKSDSKPASDRETGPETAAEEAGQVSVSVARRSAAARELHSDLLSAIGNRDWEAAEEALAELQAVLPRDHLTRLRAEGWFYLQSGDHRRAVSPYQDILRRVPDDEQAFVNLIHAHLALDERGAARRLLEQAARQDVDSSTLRSLSRSLGQ